MNQQILFNESNLYLQDTATLMWSINFVDPLNIDTYVKISFLSMAELITISWWYIKSFNKNHSISEMFNYYNIIKNDNKTLISSIWKITFDLENSSFFSWFILKSIIQGIPTITIALIIIVSFLLPTKIANFFRYLSILGILITTFLYFIKLIKKIIKTNKFQFMNYNWINIKYENEEDIINITPEYIELLKKLKNEIGIEKIVIQNWQIHLKQKVKKFKNIDKIKSLFMSQKEIDEQANIEKIKNTVFYLNNNWFVWTS